MWSAPRYGSIGEPANCAADRITEEFELNLAPPLQFTLNWMAAPSAVRLLLDESVDFADEAARGLPRFSELIEGIAVRRGFGEPDPEGFLIELIASLRVQAREPRRGLRPYLAAP